MKVFLLLLFVVLIKLHKTNSETVDLRVLFNLSQALDYFRNDSSTLSEKILYTFENDCCALQEPVLPKLRKPFIVVEGNHRKSRNVVGMRLARMMHGRYLVHPAHCLQKISKQLPKGTFFRRAFYILSLYALSIEVKVQLSLSRAVVVNGYWWDMLTFALVQAFPPDRIPDTTDAMFNYPSDLLQPDLVFFLHFPDNLYYPQATTRNPLNWKPRVLKLYKQLEQKDGQVVIQDLTGLYRPTTDTIFARIVANLSSHRDLWFDSNRGVNFDYKNS